MVSSIWFPTEGKRHVGCPGRNAGRRFKKPRPSRKRTPSPSIVRSDGTILPVNYLTDASAVAQTIGSLLAMSPGELAYVSEAYFEAPEWSFPETVFQETGVYARTIF